MTWSDMRRFLALWCALALAAAGAWAQEVPPSAGLGDERERTVAELSERVASLTRAIAFVEEAIPLATPEEQPAQLERLEAMRAELEQRHRALHRLVTGLEPRYVEASSDDAQVLWEDEARALLSPLFTELREATELPRRIERLRRRIDFFNARMPQIDYALVSAAEAMHAAENPGTKAALDRVRLDWLAKRKETLERLAITRVELSRIEGEKSSVSEAGRTLLDLIANARARVLVQALFGFLASLLAAHVLLRVLLALPRVRRAVRDEAGLRALGLVVYVGGAVVAISVVLAVLYRSGDWVLLTLAVVLLIAVLVAGRSTVPSYWREVRLLLNTGPVRAGERVTYQGVPWRVRSLNLTTWLENPAFPVGNWVRLPLSALDGLLSRPCAAEEPWFPTQRGDFVVWDGQAAEVTRQGPEFVELRRDRSVITLPTADFLSAAAPNLSHGFRHRVLLRLDPQHQKEAGREIPTRVEELVRQAVLAHPASVHLLGISAAFEAIGAWSLDVEVEADFAGAAAAQWEELLELVQVTILEACVAEGWVMARSDYGR